MKKRPELAHFFSKQCQLQVGSNVKVKSIYLFDNYRFCIDWRILQLIKIDSHRFKSFYIKQGGFHSREAIFSLKFLISSILSIPICCSKNSIIFGCKISFYARALRPVSQTYFRDYRLVQTCIICMRICSRLENSLTAHVLCVH